MSSVSTPPEAVKRKRTDTIIDAIKQRIVDDNLRPAKSPAQAKDLMGDSSGKSTYVSTEDAGSAWAIRTRPARRGLYRASETLLSLLSIICLPRLSSAYLCLRKTWSRGCGSAIGS